MKIFGFIIIYSRKIFSRIQMYILKSMFKECGKNVIFNSKDYFSFEHISLGNNVYIGPGAHFSTISEIIIGDKVLFGPNVSIIGGDHNASVVGEYMFDVKVKLPENDLPVIIEDDVWVGANVVILKGVNVGKGSIVAAGSLVNKNVPSYSIVGGIPARTIKMRFKEEDLIKHLEYLNLKQYPK